MSQSKPRVLLYCHSSLGVGHLMRSLVIARELLDDFAVGMIVGGAFPAHLRIDERINVFTLKELAPPASLALTGTGGVSIERRLIDDRSAAALDAVRTFAPNILLVEMFPFGRKKLAGEILSVITEARANGCARVFCSVRDILITTRRDQAHHDRRAAQWLNAYFDGVLVHSDPGFVRLEETFSASRSVRVPIMYTGYVADPGVRSGLRSDRVVVSAGGGRFGAELLRNALEGFRLIAASTRFRMLVIAGPLADVTGIASADRDRVAIVKYVPDLAGILARSNLSISQCGYNTTMDVLTSGVPAIFVPFETMSENEQLRRARLLAQSGRADFIRQSELTPDLLAHVLLYTPRERRANHLNLRGAENTREFLSTVASL